MRQWSWGNGSGSLCPCGRRMSGNTIVWRGLVLHPMCAFEMAYRRVRINVYRRLRPGEPGYGRFSHVFSHFKVVDRDR